MCSDQSELPTRRIMSQAAAAVGIAGFFSQAGAAEVTMVNAIGALIGEGALQRGKVRLELPPIVENGNAVSLTVSVESIHIFNQKNPQPYVAAFNFGPRAGKASVSTRIRLADSQKVVAIARLNDG